MNERLPIVRRLPVGAEIQPAGGVHFRVWAPNRQRVEVCGSVLSSEGNGYFCGLVQDAGPGTLYRYTLDGRGPFPDPASRFQPEGPHGPSQVIDPGAFRWTDSGWRGRTLDEAVISEIHIGTFTREGTWSAAMEQLPHLADDGITVLEVMPVADFAGRFGWGYDGVDLYAPSRLYGTPDDMRRFVDRAHALGLAVILDVVYNHLGPDGAYHREFSPHYYTKRYGNDWGEALNFDGEHCGPVREFFVANAGYWVDEFHLDGLRLDATQQIFDASRVNVMQEIVARVRQAAGTRTALVVAENEPQRPRLARPAARGGYGMDALWNDDFHHSAMVALTGRNEAYYSNHLGRAQELLSAIKWGYLYQGQRYAWQNARRGEPGLDLAPAAFVNFIQNHDQIANSACGERLQFLTTPGRLRAMTALMLLTPGTPMLFQGQEFAASAPFLFFADHKPELARAVREGRAEFLSQFPSLSTREAQAALADPGDPTSFERCKLDHGERLRHEKVHRLHRDLLRLRREEPALRAQERGAFDGAVLSEEALVLRYFEKDLLLLVNLGRDLHLVHAPEPLLAPPDGTRWSEKWSSENPRYGGCGTPVLDDEQTGWHIPGHAAVLLIAEPHERT